jgi:hypothetical protein
MQTLLLQALYGIRSERMLNKKLDYNLLLRWFVGLNQDDPSGIRPPSARTVTGSWSRSLLRSSTRNLWPSFLNSAGRSRVQAAA